MQSYNTPNQNKEHLNINIFLHTWKLFKFWCVTVVSFIIITISNDLKKGGGLRTPLSLGDLENLNPLNANPIKWPNTLKQFVGKLSTNCLSVFGHFVNLALKEFAKKVSIMFHKFLVTMDPTKKWHEFTREYNLN